MQWKNTEQNGDKKVVQNQLDNPGGKKANVTLWKRWPNAVKKFEGGVFHGDLRKGRKQAIKERRRKRELRCFSEVKEMRTARDLF